MSQPFARAKAMFALVAAAMSMPFVGDQKAALDKIPPYKSRGKGRGKLAKVYHGGTQKVHPAAKDRTAADWALIRRAEEKRERRGERR
jgi:hypothetical protein